MMMADEGFDLFGDGGDFDDADEDGGDLSMDLDTFWNILGEGPEPMEQQQSIPEGSSVENVGQGESVPGHGNYENLHLQNGFQVLEKVSSTGAESSDYSLFKPGQNFEASESKVGYTGGLFQSAGDSVSASNYANPESSSLICSPMQTWSGKHDSWFPLLPCPEACPSESVEASQVEIPRCSTSSSFSAWIDNSALGCVDKKDILFKHEGGDIHSKYDLHSPVMGTSDLNFGNYVASSENSMEIMEPKNNSGTSWDFSVMDADISSQNATSTESTLCQGPDVYNEWNDHYPMQHCLDAYGLVADHSQQYIPNGFYPQGLTINEEFATKMKDEREEFLTESAFSSSKMLNSEDGRRGGHVLEVPKTGYSDISGHNYSCEDGNYVSPVSGNSYSNADDRYKADIAASQLLTSVQSCISRENSSVQVKDESSNDSCYSFGVVDEAVTKKSPYWQDGKIIVDEKMKRLVPGIRPSMSSLQVGLHAMDKKENIGSVSKGARHAQDVINGMGGETLNDGTRLLNLKAPVRGLPFTKPSTSNKQLLGVTKDEKEVKLIQHKTTSSDRSKLSSESHWSNSSNHISLLDNDPDICIIEEFSQPARSHNSSVPALSIVTSQRSTYDDPLHHTGVSGTRFRANDEHSIFRAALQDLSQPNSELSPPDGLLAVDLLRHQRIALSWMVNKETAGAHCSGGILADDQGLGKTISTIALILKERPPSCGPSQEDVKQGRPETLNLDEDEDEVPEDSFKPVSNGSTPNSMGSFVQAKGRPAAGTLVVCPTSVLRQWADELHNKVTRKADISVLIYHGSSRTKDPCELAKYDVVLTTYSIVSMEVPKQPLADQDNDDDEKGNLESNVDRPMGFSSNKKRKYPPSSGKKSSKKKGIDSSLVESVAHPLAKVRWFRVVLDEAQSIKNHRTQVARACWGLRAKRRWCLSGTPIQNAIDDLYSYFRFLRYDPYSSYQEFCAKIKVPISRNSSKGYKKLQAVLKTIMLRRTKGTLLDGKPIINLPPKSVELKKVEFSKEERDFYTRLEAESRAQFEEYAAAGTVKQNYVNILLMLLRLRQACDHPLLVKGCDSSSVWRSSVESASRLPQERRSSLLTCVEDSMALCGICSDPPEDAVVTICGHVFCNQCILEHLTKDDNHCPAINCKEPLSVSSVFSRHTLNSSLSNESCIDRSSSSGSCSELLEATESRAEDSSKIRAALEVLRPLSKPQNDTSKIESRIISSDRTASIPQNSLIPRNGEFCTDKKNLVLDKGVSESVNVAGEKAIVFSQWTKMLDLLEASLISSSIQYRRLDGTMSVVARDKAVKDFNNLPEVTVMIMSLKAASLGLNMVAACHVLLLDLWWNPTTEDQAIDRAHRIGQTRPVTVLRLTVKDTVEDRILALQQKKREMVASAFGEDENGSCGTRLTVEDLKYLFTA